MKNKPELKPEHIAPHFLYGLKISVINNDGGYDVETISELREKEVLTSWRNGYYYKDIKPIFLPLSDLTKPIWHNGKKFVPADELWDCDVKEREAFEVYGEIPPYWTTCISQISEGGIDYKDFELMFKWHFDVHGLIDAGLAISVHELSENPYK